MYEFFLNSLRKYIPLSEQQALLMTEKLQVRKLRKKQWLITPGEYCKTEFFVNKGCLRAYYVDDDGHQHVLKFASEGWWISDIESLFSGNPATLYVEALEDSEVIVLQRAVQEELYESIPQLNKYFRLVYQKALSNTCGRLLRTISGTAEQHYHQFVLQYPDMEQRVPQYMIASYLGVTAEFLSKIKGRMQKG
jgi:CRP/FNR family transcriptional regulator, anaerobic regulatory protein